MLSKSEKRAIDLAWAKSFDGNSPLIRYILEVSENSESCGTLLAPVRSYLDLDKQCTPRALRVKLCSHLPLQHVFNKESM